MSRPSRSTPTVGVVVQLYRVEAYVAGTIASIGAQTVRPDELVLVDDRGADRSVDVALDAAHEAGLPVRLVTHPRNLGLSAARNSGLRELTSDLVWFCDSDDTAAPRLLEALRDALVAHDAGLAAARTALVDRAGTPLGVVEPSSRDRCVRGREYARRMLVNEARGYACNKLFRRDLLDGVEFPVGIAYEDLPVLVGLALRARRVALVDEPLYRYVTNDASISRTFGPHTLDLFAQESLVRDELDRAGLLDGSPEWARAWTRYRYDGVVLPVANMALRAVAAARATHGTVPPALRRDTRVAVARARSHVRVRDVVGLWRAGERRQAVAGAVLRASPRAYAAALGRR